MKGEEYLGYKYKCFECNGNCDPGELLGNVCTECLEKRKMIIVTKRKSIQLLNAPWEQLTFGFGGMINAGENCNGY